jgi:hypothetical protein
LTGKTYAQSEPDIISAVAARAANRGIAANGLTQKNALQSRWHARCDLALKSNGVGQLKLWLMLKVARSPGPGLTTRP